MKKFLLLIIAVFTLQTAHAIIHVQIGDLYYTIWDETGEAGIVSCNSEATKVEIPNSIQYRGYTYPVTDIGFAAFRYCTSLSHVDFNATNCRVTLHGDLIGDGMFDFSPVFPSSLKSVTIGDNVKIIPDNIFYDCTSLAEVKIGNSVTEIGNYAFDNCSSLDNIIIPNSVTYIGGSAFEECKSLTNVTIGNSVIEIDDQAFFDCTSLKSVTIPNSVTKIGKSAFADCESLTYVTIGNSVTEIDYYAFDGCSSLDHVYYNAINCTHISDSTFPFNLKSVTIGDNVKTIPAYIFFGCQDLTEVKIGNSVTEIGNYAFTFCESLTNLEFPASLKNINEGAFDSCYGIKTLIFNSDELLNLGMFAFYECENIEKICCNTSIPPVSEDFNIFSDVVYQNASLYVPGNQISDYSSATPWSKFYNIDSLEASVDSVLDSEAVTFTVFSLEGRCLLKDVSKDALQNLEPGLYIVNGKKIAIGNN